MSQLLSGSQDVELTCIDIEDQQRKVHCTDPVVMRYLTDAIRTHSAQPGSSGDIYHVSFKFGGFGSFSTVMFLIPDGFSLSIPALAGEEYFPTHDVHLTQPMPARAKELFDFLDQPWEKVCGDVLVFEDAKPIRTMRDPSIMAHDCRH